MDLQIAIAVYLTLGLAVISISGPQSYRDSTLHPALKIAVLVIIALIWPIFLTWCFWSAPKNL